MISAFGVEHGDISKAQKSDKRKAAEVGVAGGIGGAAGDIGTGAYRARKTMSNAIHQHNLDKTKKVIPFKNQRALRTGAAIGGGLKNAPRGLAVGGLAGGALYGIERAKQKRKNR